MKRISATATLAGVLIWTALATAHGQSATTQPAAPASAPPVAMAPGGPPTTGLPAGISYVQSIEGVHAYGLANGLQILLLPDSSKPSQTVAITYRVGSRHESYGETGMAHLLEHLVFKGTPKHPNIPQEFKQRGVRFNGTTWFDRTNYFGSFAASDDNLAWAIELEADRMINSHIARKDLDSEMSVVRNEFEIGQNSPGRVLYERVIATMFQWHNYGKTTIGNRSDIENVGIDNLQAFYRRYYQPDNATVVIGGKFDSMAALKLVAEHFGRIPRPNRKLEPHYTVEPVQEGERNVLVRRVGDSQIAAIAYRAMPGPNEDTAAFYLLNDILGHAPTGRLYKRLVEPGKATSVGFSTFTGHDPGYGMATAQLRKGDNIEAARDEMIAVIEGLAAEPIKPEEVKRAQARYASSYERSRLETESFAIGLSNAIATGDWRLTFWYRDRIAAVTADDVNRVAKTYFKRDNRTVGLFIPLDKPDRVEIPARKSPADLLAGYTGGKQVSAGEDFDPSQANIDKRTQVVTLSNGVKLAMLRKETRGDRVSARVSIHFGDEASATGLGVAPSMLSSLLHRGTQRLSRAQWQDELTRMNATLSFSVGSSGLTADLSTKAENLDALLRLMIETIRTPLLAETELEQIRRERLHAFENWRTDPGGRAATRMGILFNSYPKGHPSYYGTLDEQIAEWKSVTLADVKRFHAEHIGPSKGEVAVVGSFKPEEVQKALEEVLAGWKGGKPYTRIKRQQRDVTTATEAIETPEKANAVLQARHTLRMKDSDPDYAALTLANMIFGAGAMDSRLGSRLRQKEGISYGSGSSMSVGVLDDIGSFGISASYAPQFAARLETAVREELALALKDGFTQAELDRVRTGLLASRRVARADNGTLTGALASNLYYGRTMQWSADFEARVMALTAEQVSAAFRKYVDPSRLVLIKAGDFAKAAATPPASPPAGAAPGAVAPKK